MNPDNELNEEPEQANQDDDVPEGYVRTKGKGRLVKKEEYDHMMMLMNKALEARKQKDTNSSKMKKIKEQKKMAEEIIMKKKETEANALMEIALKPPTKKAEKILEKANKKTPKRVKKPIVYSSSEDEDSSEEEYSSEEEVVVKTKTHRTKPISIPVTPTPIDDHKVSMSFIKDQLKQKRLEAMYKAMFGK